MKILGLTTVFPGSIHDARALRKTSIYHKAENNEILSHSLRQINDANIRPVILGGGAYPLCPWLVKPYPQGLTLKKGMKKGFNRKMISPPVVAERASFGIFEVRWHCLFKRIDTEIANVSDQITPRTLSISTRNILICMVF